MVEICNGYYFEHDKKCESNITLVRKDTRKKMDVKTRQELDEMIEVTKTIGYFSNLEDVVKAVAKDMTARKCNDGTINNIREYLDEYKSAVKILTDAINGNDKQ